jgi:tripartite-type tricarboxylate transporter receptor subunit TctC
MIREMTMQNRRTFMGTMALTASMLAFPALAQTAYPDRPITLILPYAAGGGTDTIARVLGKALSEELKGNIVIENRPGAGGNLATDAVSNAKPDGYTLLIGNQGPMAVNPFLFKNMKNDPGQTLEPIGLVAEASLVLVVGPRMKVATMAEFVDAAKKSTLSYASASNASASHLAALLLQRAAGFKALHVPYRGASPALTDVIGGHVDFMVTTIPSVTGLIDTKQLTGLIVTGSKRAEVLPNIMTAAEAGLSAYKASAWYGLLGPKGLPADVSTKLQTAMAAALKNPELLARLKDDGASTSDVRGKAFADYIAAERARWETIVREENLSIRE